jgi:hypothetical protein
MDVNSNESKMEFKLLDLVRQHIEREKEINAHLKDKNRSLVTNLIIKNNELAENIRNLLAQFYEPPQLRDFKVIDQVRKIKRHSSETDILLNVFDKLGYIVYEEMSKRELEERERESLDEMLDYFLSWGGSSLGFSQRKKDFSTLIPKSPLPRDIDIYLNQIKNCYLLNMNEAVIGLCRILLEVACQSIYDRSKGVKNQPSYMDKERHFVKTIIGEACKAKGLSSDKREMAKKKYGEASNILHGKLPKKMTDEETLNFVREVFSIIEALY